MGKRAKQEYYDVGSSSNLSQSPKFFKIVVNPQDDKLRIPTAFIEKYGQNLPDMVTIKAPSGSVRQVELTQLDGETWLYNGWGEFKDYYSISFGHLLVFEYDGKAHFEVFIFDMTAMEIEYPLDVASEDDLVPGTQMNESKSDDDSAVILKEVHKTLKRERKRNYAKAVDNCRGATIRNKETCDSYRRAKAFKSNNPFCICLIQTSFVANGSASIPVAFARKHLPEQRNMLKLHIQKKGTWTVGCSVMPCKANMNVGWGKFVRENELKVGDTCVFEVNKRKKLLWNVTIFREPITLVNGSESEDSAIIMKGVCRSLKGKRKWNNAKEECHQIRIMQNCATYTKAKALVFENPICIRIMHPTYVTRRFMLSIPLSFTKEHLPEMRNKLKLQVQDVTWTVTCVLGPTDAKLSTGWKKFVKDNALKVGDTCVFEVNKFKKLWNVTILRG